MNGSDTRTRAQSFPKLAAEFPDMPLKSLPEIPVAWEDRSWSNEACPSFLAYRKDDGSYICVFVDYPNPAKRRLNDERFTGAWFDAAGNPAGDRYPFIMTDDWADVLAAVNEEIRKLCHISAAGSTSETSLRPLDGVALAAVKQMTQALGSARTTLETVVQNDSKNLAAKNSIRLITSALAVAAVLIVQSEPNVDHPQPPTTA